MTSEKPRSCRALWSNAAFVASVLFAVLPLAGCGAAHRASVTGKVTLDGTPLKKGDVTFVPVTMGPVAYGAIDASGNYAIGTVEAEGIPPGDYFVTIISLGDIVQPPPNQAPAAPPNLLPVKYGQAETSGFRFTINPGANVCDLPLVSQ